MQGRVFALLAFLAVALASQSFGVYQLTSGVTYTGTMAIQPTEDLGYAVDLYAIWVPENASSVNISVVNQDYDTCDYTSVFVLQGGYPCNNDDYSVSNYRCGQGYDLGDGIISSDDNVWVAGNYDYLFEWGVNRYWYIAIGRYSSYYYNLACSYQVTATINSTCASGSVGLPYSLSSYSYSQCSQPYNTVSTYPSSFTVTGSDTSFPVFKVSVPLDTGNFQFTVNTTIDTNVISVYGRSYGAPSYSSYNCDDDSYTDVGNFSIYNVICYTPRAGDFWIVIYSDYDTPYNAVVTFQTAPQVCANGTGGWNCSFVSIPFTGATQTITIPYSSTATYLTYAFWYTYIDIPENYTSNPISLTATSADAVTYFYRRNGYPEYDSTFGYESTYEYYGVTHTYNLNQFDWSVPGRIYFGLECDTSPSCSVTLSVNGSVTSTSATSATSVTSVSSTSATSVSSTSASSTSASSTSASSTSASSTSASSTSGATSSTSTGENQSSSAAFVIPSAVFAVVAAALALF